jgi:hypothetical protein
MKQAGVRNFLGKYKLPAKAISNKHLDHKDAFYDYIDGKISKEEYDKITQQFLASDPALQPKQQMLPGFDDLFKESADREKLPYRATTKVILQEPDGSIVARKGKGKKSLDLPGGGIDPGETSIQALKREVKEETGITPKNIKHQKTVKWDWPEKFKGKRGEKFRGENTHIFTADVGSKGKQTSDEGDDWGKVTSISKSKATKLITKAMKEKGSNKYPAAQAEVLDEVKEAGLGAMIARAKTPLKLRAWGRPSGTQTAVHKILNVLSPQWGKAYQRRLEFQPRSYKDTGMRGKNKNVRYDMRIDDRINDLKERAEDLAYTNFNTPRYRVDDIIDKLNTYRREQRQITKTPLAGLYTGKII